MAIPADVILQEKQQFATVMRGHATAMANLLAAWYAGVKVYQEKGFGPGAGAPWEITDADLEALGITAADLVVLITFGIQVQQLNDNQAATPGYYAAAMAKVRTDF